jgi:hypothetical protein
MANALIPMDAMMNQPQERNWWNRNWKWFVPLGCLGTIFAEKTNLINYRIMFKIELIKFPNFK